MHISLFTVLGFIFILAIFAFIAVPWYRKYKANKVVQRQPPKSGTF